MEYKCPCGTISTLNDQEALSAEFRCPHCGKIRDLGKPSRRPHPKPLVAGLLAVLSPGLGHLYAGGLKFAISLLVVTIVLSNILWFMIIFWEAPPFNVLIPLVISAAFLVYSIVSAVRAAQAYHTAATKPKRLTKFLHYAAVTVGTWVLAALVVPIFGSYGTYVTPTASMANTIMAGDRILCDESAYDNSDPQRGDLVMFLFPGDKKTLHVKRCIAVGGDSVLMIDKKVFVNGAEVSLPPTGAHSDSEIVPKRDNFGPYRVPAGSYFVLGDYRDDSYDSRFWGSVDRSLITGRAIRVWFNFKLGRVGVPLK